MLKSKRIFVFTACLALFAALFVVAACGHRGGNNPAPSEPTITYKIQIVSGNNQSGPVGVNLIQPLKVYVTDAFGVKQSSVVVQFSVKSGYADLSSLTELTDSDGYCQITARPAEPGGAISVEAKVQYTDVSVTFSLTGT